MTWVILATSGRGLLARLFLRRFLSRFDRKKGLDLLLPAFKKVRERFPSAALVLAGSGNSAFVRSLQTQARALGIAAGVFERACIGA